MAAGDGNSCVAERLHGFGVAEKSIKKDAMFFSR